MAHDLTTGCWATKTLKAEHIIFQEWVNDHSKPHPTDCPAIQVRNIKHANCEHQPGKVRYFLLNEKRSEQVGQFVQFNSFELMLEIQCCKELCK